MAYRLEKREGIREEPEREQKKRGWKTRPTVEPEGQIEGSECVTGQCPLTSDTTGRPVRRA